MSLGTVDYLIAQVSLYVCGKEDQTPYIKECLQIFDNHKLKPIVHATGTNIEGPAVLVMRAIEECRKSLHSKGLTKLEMNIHLSSRTDRPLSMAERVSKLFPPTLANYAEL